MIVEGRTIAVILVYISTFIGYLLGRTIAIEEKEIEIKHKRLKMIATLLEKYEKENQ